MATTEMVTTAMATTSMTSQTKLFATVLSFVLAVMVIVTTTVVFFPRSHPVIKAVIGPINRAIARSIGWLFVALLWPWIWLLNLFNPYEVPYLQEHLHGISTVNLTVTPSVNPSAIPDFRARYQKRFDQVDQEEYPSVFSDDEDEEK